MYLRNLFCRVKYLSIGFQEKEEDMNKKEDTAKDLLNAFAEELSGGTNTTKLKALYEVNHLDEDLSIGFNDYFLLQAFRHVIQTKSSEGGISLISNEDNNGVPQFYKDKSYIQKAFEIKKYGRNHVVQISIQEKGVFKSLIDNEFINSLIWGIDPAQDYLEGTRFDQEMDSIHFIYTGDNSSKTDEIVILSIQSFV